MLNEIKEFEQYTTKPEDEEKHRLKYITLLKEKLGGIERAMTVIARHYIFDGEYGGDFDVEKEEKVREILKAWCGFNSTAEVAEKDWLKDYIKQVFLDTAVDRCKTTIKNATIEESEKEKLLSLLDKKELVSGIPLFKNDEEMKKADEPIITNNKGNKNKKITIRNVEELKRILKNYSELNKETTYDINVIHFAIQALYLLSFKNRSFSHKLYYAETTKTDNDLKSITYERIIANALELGKLETYYLVCEKDLFEAGLASKKTTKKENTTTILPLPKGSKKDITSHKNARDLILKITASYLLQKNILLKNNTEQDYVYYNQADIKNWLVLEKAEIGSKGLSIFRYGKEKDPAPLFNVTTISNNVSKLKVHSEWIKNFRLIKAEDIKNLKSGLIYYSDCGAGECLEKHVVD